MRCSPSVDDCWVIDTRQVWWSGGMAVIGYRAVVLLAAVFVLRVV